MNKFLILLIGAVLGIAGFLFLIHGFHNIHITANFEELEPFNHRLNVYYKGFKLGHTLRVYPSKDFKNTHVDMMLSAKHLNLPDNITAKIRRKDKKDYIELEYPTAPSVTYLRNHTQIKGTKGRNFTDFIESQSDNGGLDDIRNNLNSTIISAGETLDALNGMIQIATEILTDLRPSLKESGDNLALASKNLANFTAELNSAAHRERLNNTFSNIELMTVNLERTTRNFHDASLNVNTLTQNANKETIRLTNCVLKNINTVVLNINDIVKGLKETLSKHFGAMRMMFGKPIDNNQCRN